MEVGLRVSGPTWVRQLHSPVLGYRCGRIGVGHIPPSGHCYLTLVCVVN